MREGVPVVHSVRHPVQGGLIELRLFPTEDGVSGLLLRAGRPRASDVLDRVSDLYLACDDEWRLTLVNARAADYLRMLGPERGDPVGRSVWDVIPGLAGSRFQAEAYRAMVEQAEVEFEGYFAPLKRWFSVRITPTAEGVIACARDVTGWRQTRRVLTREAERLAAVIDTQQAVATAGPDLGAVMRVVSERLQALTWAGAAGIFVPDDDALVLCEASGSGRDQVGLRVAFDTSLVGRAYASGEAIRSDDLTLEPDADRAAIEALGARSAIVAPLRTEQHGIQAVVAVWSARPRAFNELHAHTIRLLAGLLSAALERASAFAANQVLLAERTAALAAIQAAEERFRTLVESIDDVVFRLDREQRCVDIFGRWLGREGYRPADFLGKSTAEIVGRPASGAHERANLRALAGETVTYEWTRESRRGTRHMQTTLSPLRGARGEVAGIVGVGRDITQRIEAEEQFRQAQKMEAVGRLAGGVAHDFNNLLTVILGLQRLPAGRRSDPGDPRRGDVEEIRKAGERAAPHPPAAGLQPPAGPRAARSSTSTTVVDDMERMLRPPDRRGHRARHRASAPDLGGVKADPGQLEQVVMNLAVNARDAMPQAAASSPSRRRTSSSPEGYAYRQLGVDIPAGPYVLLAVSDTGAAWTPEVRPHLFEPFFTTKAARAPAWAWPRSTASSSRAAATSGSTASRARAPRFKIYLPRVLADDADGARSPSGAGARARAPRPCCWSRTRTRSALLASPRPRRARATRCWRPGTARRRWPCWPARRTADRPAADRRGHAGAWAGASWPSACTPASRDIRVSTCRATPRATSSSRTSAAPRIPSCRSRSRPRASPCASARPWTARRAEGVDRRRRPPSPSETAVTSRHDPARHYPARPPSSLEATHGKPGQARGPSRAPDAHRVSAGTPDYCGGFRCHLPRHRRAALGRVAYYLVAPGSSADLPPQSRARSIGSPYPAARAPSGRLDPRRGECHPGGTFRVELGHAAAEPGGAAHRGGGRRPAGGRPVDRRPRGWAESWSTGSAWAWTTARISTPRARSPACRRRRRARLRAGMSHGWAGRERRHSHAAVRRRERRQVRPALPGRGDRRSPRHARERR